MSQATLEDVLAALAALGAALEAERDARKEREARAAAFVDALASFRGGVSSTDLADVTRSLQTHAARLEQIARP